MNIVRDENQAFITGAPSGNWNDRDYEEVPADPTPELLAREYQDEEFQIRRLQGYQIARARGLY